LVLLFFASVAAAQTAPLGSLLKQERSYLREDSVRAKLLTEIARRYHASNPVLRADFAQKSVKVAEKLSDKSFSSMHSASGAPIT
jgi:hypothetical protein